MSFLTPWISWRSLQYCCQKKRSELVRERVVLKETLSSYETSGKPGRKGGTVVRALSQPPHQCNPGAHYGVDSICGLNLWLVLSLIVPRGFSSGLTSGFPLSSKISTSKFQGSRGRKSKAKNFHSSARLRRVGFDLGRLKLMKYSWTTFFFLAL